MRECAGRIRDSFRQEGLFSEADRDFHMTLFRPIGNSVLTSALEAIWAVDVGFQLELKRTHMESSVRKHEAIVDALEQYDFFAFAKAMEAHFSSGKYSGGDSYEEY